jgi:hypothetical protein
MQRTFGLAAHNGFNCRRPYAALWNRLCGAGFEGEREFVDLVEMAMAKMQPSAPRDVLPGGS